MVPILVDEAYALDFLVILYVKMVRVDNEQNRDNYYKCLDNLKRAIGDTKLDEIMKSVSYAQLYVANDRLFKEIERIRKSPDYSMTAKELDDLNTERWKAKKNLQSRFFGKQTETKTV